jgi:hypothetical protein
VGTGDGRAVLRAAARDPDALVIGLDAVAAPLAEASRRAARPVGRGGLPNALFVVAGIEAPPPELTGLGQAAGELSRRGAVLLAISGDSPFCHTAFLKAHPFPFPLLSDVHRTVISAYGVLDADRNVAYRSTFVIDRDGILRWGQAGDRHMVRDGIELLRVVDLVNTLRQPA